MKYRHCRWSDDVEPPTWPGQAVPCLVKGRYDLIIGSDLLYERDTGGALAAFIDAHCIEGGEVWIVDPDRSNRPAFNRQMTALGFQMREVRLAHPASQHDATYRGRLLEYRREGS
jgi:hypothetical protein